MDIILIETGELTFREVSGFLGCVTRARRESIDRKKNETDKLNALLGELLLISEIEARTGIPRRKIAFEKGRFGKPYLKGEELWFSLSHTKGAVCAAFSREGETGVDIERRDRRFNEILYKRTLCAEEQALVCGGEDFLRMWVKKEAFLKRLGVGITRDLRGVNTLTLPDTEAMEAGEYLLGASGEGAASAKLIRLTAEELLGRFVRKN